ncbi:MAG: serine/threonine-protein kinase [Polyangiales bacterium]
MSPRSFETLPPIGTIGNYDILGRIGVGGMAEVFLARETVGERRIVVVKRALPHVSEDPRHIESLRQEARLLARLRHPSLCRTIEFGTDEGSIYFAMEWVDGVDLRALAHRAAEKGGIPPILAARIAADVASALHHAHTAQDERGQPLHVVHRDVTPENILVGFDGTVKLLDFGIAKATGHTVKTQHGELKGKFGYMSPEQYHALPLDGRSDVFSLGVCAYESLTGKPLFDRGDEFQTVAAVIFEGAVPSLRESREDVPSELDFILKKALAKKRDERFQSAEAFEHALRSFGRAAQARMAVPSLGEYVRALFPKEAADGPRLDRSPLKKTVREAQRTGPRTAAERAALAAEIEAEEKRIASESMKKHRNLAIGVLLVVGLGIGVTAYAVSRRPPPVPEVPAAGP